MYKLFGWGPQASVGQVIALSLSAIALTAYIITKIRERAIYSVHVSTAEGKKVLITGGSSGLGRQLAIQFAAVGFTVYITGRSEERLKETVSLCKNSDRHRYFVFSLTDDTALQAFQQELHEEEFEYLILNAGVGFQNNKASLSDTEDVMRVNFTSQAYLALNLKYDRLVSIASPQALFPVPRRSLYSASKAALYHFTKCLVMDGTTQATICYPRWFESNLRKNSLGQNVNRENSKNAMPAQYVARRICADALAEKNSSMLTTTDWLLHRLLNISGGLVEWLIAVKMK